MASVGLRWRETVGWIVKDANNQTVNGTGGYIELKDGYSLSGVGASSDSSAEDVPKDMPGNYVVHYYDLAKSGEYSIGSGSYDADGDGTAEATNLYFEINEGRIDVSDNAHLRNPALASVLFPTPFLVRVKTNGAITGTRGTTYTVTYLPGSNLTTIGCHKGEVYFRTVQDSFVRILKPGQVEQVDTSIPNIDFQAGSIRVHG